MTFKNSWALPVLAIALAGGCASQAAPQVVSGRLDTTTFPAAVTAAQVVRAGQVITEAPIAADGSFSLTIPPGSKYHIVFASTAAQPGLIFPRSSGTLDVAFYVRGGGAPFDLGTVRYVGDPTGVTYRTVPSDGDDVECEDGIDPTTGAVCVDDDDDEGAGPGACEADEGDGVNCEDGIDPATGAECDGGPAANQDDGTEESGEESDDEVPEEAVVADHNLPATIGCGEEDAD